MMPPGAVDALKERLDRHRSVHRLLAAWAAARARIAGARGKPWSAACPLLGAWRYAGETRVAPATRDAVERLVRAACYDHGVLRPLAANGFLREYVAAAPARARRRRWASVPLSDRVRLRKPRPDNDPERQGNLMVLKAARPETGEKGVLLGMYSETLLEFPAVFDLPRLVERYRLVLEPSTWGYQDPAFLLYLGADADVFVLAQHREDFDHLEAHGHGLLPMRLGAGDWVDPEAFRPSEGRAFDHDVVMVSAWDPVKRHHLLFEAMAELRARHGRTLTAALVGYPMRWTRERVERLAAKAGVADQCTFFEAVPPARVAEIVSRARASLLLSTREGANRAVYESLFCDTPVLVPRHHWGVNLDVVNADTGRLFDDADLAPALLAVLDGRNAFHPRDWARANTGWEVSTRRLNEVLRRRAAERGEPWTEDIAPRKSEPNLRYAHPGEWRRFEAEVERLAGFLLPPD